MDPASKSEVPLKNPALAALLAWAVPGLGHLYQGRRGKAALYFTCILGLFFVGLAMGEGKVVFWRWTNPRLDPENFRYSYVGQFFVGLAALPALLQSTLAHYGSGPILGGYLAVPTMEQLNATHRLGKIVEIGWVYTVIAGLLNVLAIFDAYEGPAYTEDEEAAVEKPSAAKFDGLRTEPLA